MRLLPFYQETLVLPFHQQETARRLRLATRPLEKGIEYTETVEENFLFNGWVGNDRFRISRKVRHPENFLPLIIGQIEGTSNGSILFVRYRLFFSAAMFLIFWSVITLLLCLFFLLIHQQYIYGLMAGGLGILNYVIATKNFHLQIRSSRKALDKALNKAEQFPHGY
jgi:hypothetical protein